MENIADSSTRSALEPELLTSLSEIVNRLDSYSFQSAHASRLRNDLGFSANKVLYVLGAAGPCRPSVLAVQLATGRANVSKVVRQLEQQGLIARRPDPDDFRAYLVALTPSGEQRAAEVFHIGNQMLREVMADWSPIEVAAFTGLMARFSEGVGAYERRLADRLRTPARRDTGSAAES